MKRALLLGLVAAALGCPIPAPAQTAVFDLGKCADGPFMGYDLAIDYCTKAIKSGQLSNRNLGTAYWHRASFYSRQGKLSLALADLSETVRLDALVPEPDHLRAATFYLRGTVHLTLRNVDSALADFNESLRLDQSNAAPFLGRGQVGLARRDADQALADFTRALKANVPDKLKQLSGSAYAPRARSFDRTSYDSVAYFGRGQAYLIKNDPAAAMLEYNEAIRVNPAFVPALRGRAALHEQRGDYAAAVVDHTAALQANPRDPAGYFERGRAWALQGEYANAALDFDATLQLGPRHHAARFSRAVIAVGEGDYGLASDGLGDVMRNTHPQAALMLWRHVARARGAAEPRLREEAREELARDSAKLAERSLHARVVAFYLGHSDESGLRAPGRTLGDACAADYFLAQHHLIGGEQARGAELLAAVAKQCPATLQETWAARLELQRLQQR